MGEGFDDLPVGLVDLEVVREGVCNGHRGELGESDGLAAGEMGGFEDFFDERGIVLREDAQGVAGFVGHATLGKREGEVDGLLGGGWAGEQTLVDQGHEQRVLAAIE